LIESDLITGNKNSLKPLLYHGVTLIADIPNPLRLVLMTGSATSYSVDPSSDINEYPAAVGRSTILIGALQARNNARIIISGSIDFFSNKFFGADVNKIGATKNKPEKSGNYELAVAMTKWLFKETGVLRIKSVDHHIVGQNTTPPEYTIMDIVKYTIGIEEILDKRWVPFQGKDVQLEFVRIDPFIRTTLKNNNGNLSVEFKVPDVYGVFKFLVDYHRLGYTHLYDVQQVSVIPLRHTQYERFSRCAYPYYVSALSMIIGVLIFSIVFLYHKDQAVIMPNKASFSGKTGKS